MLKKTSRIAPVAATLALALAPGANADITLGSVGPAPGASPQPCNGFVAAQLVSTTGTPFTVPPGGGALTTWQTNTTSATPGAPLTFVVLRPTGGDLYTVVAVDNEVLPNPLPLGNVATFTLPAPIFVSAGDTLGLTSTTFQNCLWNSGSTPQADGAVALTTTGPLTPGQTLNSEKAGGPTQLDVAATLVVNEDVAVSADAIPNPAGVGHKTVLSSTVTNNGPSSMPITVTDGVPAGLRIDAAAAGAGTCTTSGQLVTCTITGLAQGQSVPVNIVVTPTQAKSYTNSLFVQSNVPDPVPANNSASVVLTAQAAPSPSSQCLVPNLKGVRAQLAKKMLGLLGCTVGKVKRVHSKKVPKGAVIKTTPGAGTYAGGKVVGIQVSSGRKGHKHH